ncbi:type II secretion system protein GspD [Azoarcus sp. DD4]|nr:type II secretion system protein GspD [Azoarcus sp. DD4]
MALHFEQAPVTEVVHAILGDLLRLDYALVTPLAGELTLHTQGPVPRDQVLSLLESALQANGMAMVADASGRYRIGKAEAMAGAVPLVRRADARAAGGGAVIVPLRYIGAAEMAEILRPVASAESLLRVDTVRNLLMLSGTRNQIDGWLEIINTFDVDFLKGMSVGLFPLDHGSARDVEAALKALLGSSSIAAPVTTPAQSGGSGGTNAANPAPARGARGAANARERAAGEAKDGDGAGPLAGLVRVMAIERLNALLVVTPRAHYLEQMKTWIERLDQSGDGDADGQLYVYPVQNGSARHLADLLNGLYGTTAVGGVQATGVAPGLGRGVQASVGSAVATSGSAGTGSGGTGSGGTGFGAMAAVGGTGTGTAGGAAAVTQVDMGEHIRVVADNRNNALLIHANRREYRRIEAALRRLDVAPTQVLIEASIVEVTLSDELRYGLQWYFQNTLRDGWSGSGQLSNNTSGALANTGQGFFYSVINPAGSVRAVLNMLATKSLLNVLSNPTVMVQDNHTATIQVGDQQPIRSSTTVTDGGTTTSSIQYKDTGVLLAVTPSVNAGDMVGLDVNQAITDVGETDSATGQRAFNQRQVVSRVSVRSGETIVLGGLIRDNKTRDRQGIPWLHDLPVVGNLFGSTAVGTVRTELLVMITPRVIRSEQDVREIGSEMRNRMRGLQGLDGDARSSLDHLDEAAAVTTAEATGSR